MIETVNTGKVELWSENFGDKNNQCIVLIAGAMAPAVFWDTDFCNKLSSLGYFVIRFDNRDMGYSTHFPPCRPDSNTDMPYNINDMADDVNSILEHYKKDKAIIVGHSLGSVVAQIFAINYPEKCERLFLISSPIIAKGQNKYIETDTEITQEMWQVLMSNKMYQDYERGKEEFFRAWKYLNGAWELDEEMAEEYTKRLYETEYIEPAYNHTKVQENIPDIYKKLNDLQFSKHFIYGELDYLASNLPNIKTLVNSLDNTDLTILPNAGHLFFNKELWDKIFNTFCEKQKVILTSDTSVILSLQIH